ncbi:PQQ-binding-like beta-propeller repeat protein [Actinoplanes oblitus]|uniref:PQQ-binding-like beta-propeller repeat protein n=1 Tax=Actinoplanes oblitus TaxID=3040509 RepID=A0ABY8WEE4_9ACTN|nr:PQQ-binding-like beta-propeller repeat protein [Actinoplanes oblitus]WIM96201.1 PQQ-binding-like beta-propeller repeat protein [Actinoplanes oblitus]
MTRVLLRTSVALLLLLATVLVGWRILEPAEVLATAETPYPAPTSATRPRVTSGLSLAPLLFEDRLRLYGSKHQVRADEPVTGRFVRTARWSLRRWPQQLSGVVTSGTTVVSRWSDGLLVGQDGRTGKVLWRTSGPDAPDYAGHRTGAAAVWSPPGLRTGAGIVVVAQGQDLFGYDVSTGTERWHTATPPGCTGGFTTGDRYLCATGGYDLGSGAALRSGPAGPFTALGCPVAGSDCAGFRDGAGHGWLTRGGVPQRSVALDSPAVTIAGGVPVSTANGLVTAYRPDGGVKWTWPATGVRVLGGNSTRILLMTPRRELVGLDAATGERRFQFGLFFGKQEGERGNGEWVASGVLVSERFVAIERKNATAPDDPDSPTYYFSSESVLLAAI